MLLRTSPPYAMLALAVILMGGCDNMIAVARRNPDTAAQPVQPPVEASLHLPNSAQAAMPQWLSQTGVFTNLATLTPVSGLLPYEVNAPLWTDGARKKRWLLVPRATADPQSRRDDGAIGFSRHGEWYLPSGTVAVKQFDLATDERDPTVVRRLETRILTRGLDGQVFGAAYRWRDDQQDAELLTDARSEPITITTATGTTRTQLWTYPGRADCLTCHNRTAGGLLGVNTRQLNRNGYDGVNQIAAWNRLGLFDPPVEPEPLTNLPRLPSYDDYSITVEDRVRSYLDANCSHCHRPGAMQFASYDARFETPLERQNLLFARPANDYGIDRVRYVKPNDPWRSMVLVRLLKTDSMKMPPLGRNVPDKHAIAMFHQWITSMEGPQALPPVEVTLTSDPAQGTVMATAQHPDRHVTLHYTLDGSIPHDNSPRYTTPLRLTPPATLRIKALRDGFASSVAVPVLIVEDAVKQPVSPPRRQDTR